MLGVIAVFTVFLSWFTVNTLFTLRYASLYYTEPIGGIDFPDTAQEPDYLDFVYVAFTIGMTFQVSDVRVTAPSIRRAVLLHALLSFVYNTAIIALALNLAFANFG